MYARACAACLVATLAASAAAQDVVQLRLPGEEKVAFKGVVNADGLGSATHVPVYPVAGIAGAIAALLTHGILVNTANNMLEIQRQESANSVLGPHREVLDKFTHRELLTSAAARMRTPGAKQVVEAADPSRQGVVVEGTPQFSMTSDRRAILLDHALVIRKPTAQPDAGFQIVVRVVSAPAPGEDLLAYWSGHDGARLKEESAGLLARSIDTALQAMKGAQKPDAPYRTIRYLQGDEEKMERAQLLEESCDDLLVRNLRGWLMVLPARAPESTEPADPQCSVVARPG